MTVSTLGKGFDSGSRTLCLGAVVTANIRSVVYGAEDDYTRARSLMDSVEYARHRIHHYVGGSLADEARALYARSSQAEAEMMRTGQRSP